MGRWGAPQTPTAPQPQWAPQLNPASYQTSSPGSPVSCGIPGRAWGWPGPVEDSHWPQRRLRPTRVPAPGPRWVLVTVAAVVGVLAVSCLLCVLCCCCRRHHRRKPRDKEAVGLGSARSSTTTHLVSSGRQCSSVPSSQLGQSQWAALSAGSGARGGPVLSRVSSAPGPTGLPRHRGRRALLAGAPCAERRRKQ